MTEAEKALEINTDGWNEVACDKCGKTTSFDPTVKFEDMKCMACMPEMTWEEWERAQQDAAFKAGRE